jgi:hypothetical protein
MAHRVSIIVATTASVLVGASLAAAQTTSVEAPKIELSAGYQLVRAGQVCDEGALTQTCVPNRTFPIGFAVDGARNFGSWGVVGEGGWSSDSDQAPASDLDFKMWHLAGGGRWTSRRHPRLWPYGQFLVGVVQNRVSGSANGQMVDASATSFMLQPGAGLAFLLGEGWAAVGQFDYRRVFLDSDENLSSSRSDVRLFIGLRLIIK